jgi:hypothetical protein
MNSIILHHHLGLGDHFVCNGMVNFLSDSYDLIYLPCKKNNFNTVQFLYSENNKVKIFKIDNSEFEEIYYFSKIVNIPIFRVGFQNCNINEWNTSFYSQLNLDFSIRYSRFQLPKNITNQDNLYNLLSKDNYCLIHRESSEGKYQLNIDNKNKNVEVSIESDPYGNLLNYVKLIKNAKEIHCINSSFFHLVDSIDTNAKLFYHDIRKKDFKILDKWKIITYD